MLKNEYLLLEIKRILSNIKRYIYKLEANEYYSENNKFYLEIHEKFIDIFLSKNLEEILPSDFFIEFLIFLNHKLIPTLRYVKRSQTKDVPWSLIPNLEKIVNGLLGDNYIILLRPQWNWNYTVMIYDRCEYLKSKVMEFTSKDLRKIDKKVHIISFPILEKTNFLLHTIIGHEIGHFYQKNFFDKNLTNKWEKQKNYELITKLKEKRSTKKTEDSILSRIEDAKNAKEIIRIYKGMVREIIPDIIGYLIFGPSMLFVLYYFHFWHPDTSPSIVNQYYPPLNLRIKILQELFDSDLKKINTKNRSYISTLNKFNKEISEYLLKDDFIKFSKSSNNFEIAYEIFKGNKSKIIDFCYKKVNPKIYNFDIDNFDDLIEKLVNLIPPNESKKNEPVQLADIFLSGWIYIYKTLLDNKSIDKDYNEIYSLTSKLLLKASSSIYIHEHYRGAISE